MSRLRPAALLLLLVPMVTRGAKPPEPPARPAPKAASPLAPLPATPGLVTHAPFESGSCTPCHERDDAKDPGTPAAKINPVCLGCHTELEEVLALKGAHAPAQDACTHCHNPHNSRTPKLLLAKGAALCGECHGDVVESVKNAKVRHRALAVQAECANCHNPHGASGEKLLRAPLQTLCLDCHDREGMSSVDGKPLSNMKAWLQQNKIQHSPVASGMCTSCHLPHGGDQARLLVAAYPPDFYAAYSQSNYALCFTCHDEGAFTTPRTTEHTGFRNGSKNLHYVHVSGMGGRGRTCRACHEVHASNQDHHLRESVPYGSRGWALKLNYAKAPNGGSCSKTCHETRSYDRRAVEPTAKAPAAP